jgi:predicted DNA-binding protein with PD1-like motif
MILTISKQSRRFVGRFDLGDDLLERLNSVAETHHIRTATFTAGGTLRDPELATYLSESKQLGPKVRHDGDWFVASLRGSISQRGKQREISIQAHLLGAKGKPVYGFLSGGSVVFLEVSIDTLDDIVLVRDLDPAIGVSQWMGVQFPEADDEAGGASEGASAPRPRRSSHLPSFLLDDDDIPEVFKGDFLEHPTLGKCKVVNIHEDDRVTVMLPEQGKLAEINLEFFAYKIIRKEAGRQFIRLEVKRK